ncbi:MAG TPA: PQQ-binding-like beta-propeller repeat protein, partial [Clostridia bacterium]|nr:PQQ-binding-like beta-propeller repeat protein [Clostridia bacterium]
MHIRSIVLIFLLLSGSSLTAHDWPQWRGPQRNGISSEKISVTWPAEGPKLVWSSLAGTGFSSISISKGLAYTMGNTNGQDTIWCLDAHTGKAIWKRSYPAQLSPQWYEGGPGATPTVDSNRVFTISKWGDVFCLDAAKGDVVWQRDLRQDHYKPNRWGFAGSPLIWRNLVILNAGTAGTALDRDTGRIVWSNGTNTAGYASPVLFRSGDKEVVLIFALQDLIALDPETGRELWRHHWKTDWDTNNTDPLVHRDAIFLSSFSRGCALLSLKQGKPEVVYDNKALFNNLSPGILLGDYLYG